MSRLIVVVDYQELAAAVGQAIAALNRLKLILDEAVIQQEGVNYEKLPND